MWLCASITGVLIVVLVSVNSCVSFGSERALRIGTQAPEFRLTDFDGNEVVLTEIVAQNKYVLVEFWASWCGPCVAKIPDLKNVYSQYDKGAFEILSIARESTRLDWAEATKIYDLPWVNLAELGEYSGVVGAAHRLSGLPLNYLIATDGTILAKDISVDELETFLLKHVSTLNHDDATPEY